jgi:hypothetical protein
MIKPGDELTHGLQGAKFKAQAICEQCFSLLRGGAVPLDCFCGAQDVLEELVELKRLKDTSGDSPEYQRRKLLAWREAFRVCGIIEEPKP